MAETRKHSSSLAQVGVRAGAFVAVLVVLGAASLPMRAFAQSYGDGIYGNGTYGAPVIYGNSSGGTSTTTSSGGGGGGGGSISVPVTTPSNPPSTSMNGGSGTTTPVASSTPATNPSMPTNAGSPNSGGGSAYMFYRTLSQGDTGSDVRALQEYLKSLGYLSVDKTTDYYGSLTSGAIQKYQCDKGIVCKGDPDSTGWGNVGPRTLVALNGVNVAIGGGAAIGTTTPQMAITTSSTTPSSAGLQPFSFTRTLYRGVRGNDVSAAQGILVRLGYLAADSVTGYFGTLTWKAVMSFQCDKAIVCTGDEISTGWGVIGPKTAALLNSL